MTQSSAELQSDRLFLLMGQSHLSKKLSVGLLTLPGKATQDIPQRHQTAGNPHLLPIGKSFPPCSSVVTK